MAAALTDVPMSSNTNGGWLRVSGGHYRLGPWVIRGSSKGGWWLFENGRLWGRWRRRGEIRVYRPFKTLAAAVTAADEVTTRRFEGPSDAPPPTLAC
jgi:hypothetical protein